MEIREEQLGQPQTDKRDIYIKDVIELFKSEFIIEKDKVKYSKSNPNVRLHYLDIRDHLGLFYIKNIIYNDILPIIKSLKNYNLSEQQKNSKIKTILKHIKLLQNHIKTINKTKHHIQINQSQKFNKKTQSYYLNKIIHQYNNDYLKTHINDFLNINILEFIYEIRRIFSHIIGIIVEYNINKTNNIYLDKIITSFDSLNIIIIKMYTIFTDVYFLRRILDKDYIHNVITYCGNYHALNYIYFLIKYCNFEIKKIYDSNSLTIKDDIDKLKNINYVQEIYNLFLHENNKIKQCVDTVSINEIIVLD